MVGERKKIREDGKGPFKFKKGDVVIDKGSSKYEELRVVSVRKDRIRAHSISGYTSYFSDDYGTFVYGPGQLTLVRRSKK